MSPSLEFICRRLVCSLAGASLLMFSGCQSFGPHRARQTRVHAANSRPATAVHGSEHSAYGSSLPELSRDEHSEFDPPAIPFDHADSAPDLESAIATLREAGGKLRPDDEGRIVAIDLAFSRVTNRQLRFLSMFPEVRELDLTGTQLDDDSAVVLTELPKLEALKLKGTAITSLGIAELASLESLVLLDASSTSLTDDALQTAANWIQLRYLSLNDTAISDDGLQSLESLTSLRGLSLINTSVTKDGVRKLKASLPDCLIVAQTDAAQRMQSPDAQLTTVVQSLVPTRLGTSAAELQPVIDLAAQQPQLATHLAVVYSDRHQWAAAARILEAAAVSDVADKSIHFALGEALARSGQFDPAHAHFTLAVGEAAASYNVGLIQYELSLAACERQFADALELDPTLESAQHRLVEVRKKRQQLARTASHGRVLNVDDARPTDEPEVLPAPAIRPVSRSRQSVVR